jgi:mannose-6-phosphate isomerase-like protein (cupin superfamily)
MRHFQFIGRLEVMPLVVQIGRNADLWGSFGWRKESAVHREMDDIWIRYNRPPENGDYSHFNDEHHGVFYPAWERLPALRPLVFTLMSALQATELGGVLITRIPPGRCIAPHADDSWHVQHFNTKCYTVLETNDRCWYRCADEQLVMKVGEVWTFDNRKEHEVQNEGGTDRMTLITCLRCE